jgi:hypothetical protein
MDDRHDRELVDAALEGAPVATRRLVDRLLPTVDARVRHTLARYSRRDQGAQVAGDLTQHVFLMLFEHDARRLRAWQVGRGASLTTFVGLVAEREVIAILRRERRNPWTEAPTEDDELTRRAGTGGDAEAHIAERDLAGVVLDRALSRLDERGLLLFQRLLVDEADSGAVATEMGTTLGALYMWKSRFAKLVRELADELGKEPPRSRPTPLPLQPLWKAR